MLFYLVSASLVHAGMSKYLVSGCGVVLFSTVFAYNVCWRNGLDAGQLGKGEKWLSGLLSRDGHPHGMIWAKSGVIVCMNPVI